MVSYLHGRLLLMGSVYEIINHILQFMECFPFMWNEHVPYIHCVFESSRTSQLSQKVAQKVIIIWNVFGGAICDGRLHRIPEAFNVIASQTHCIDLLSVRMLPIRCRFAEVVSDHEDGLAACEVLGRAAHSRFFCGDR